MLNHIVLVGRLANDPDMRYTNSGIPVARMTLAVSRGIKDKEGKNLVDFIPVVVWRKLAETCTNHLKKGMQACVEGRLETRTYEKGGKKQKVFEVLAERVYFLEWPKNDSVGQEVAYNPEDIPF